MASRQTKTSHDSVSRNARWKCLSLAVLVLVLAGCGGTGHDSGTASVTTPTSTAPQTAASPKSAAERRFISQADLVCRKLGVVLDLQKKPKSNSLSEAARIAPGRAELEQRAVVKLKRLSPPPGLAGPWRKIVGLRASLAEELGEYGRAAAADDTKTVAALTQSKLRVHRQLGAVGRAAGFNDCSAVR